jgi:predicted thioesterase
MDLEKIVQVGMAKEMTFLVEEEHLAIHIGSGSARVLATPWMITYLERTARLFLAELLPEGYSSVGVHVDVRHLAPTPFGGTVRTRVEVVSVDGVKIDFSVEAWDEHEHVGGGSHRRVVIDEARFLRRVAKKEPGTVGE